MNIFGRCLLPQLIKRGLVWSVIIGVIKGGRGTSEFGNISNADCKHFTSRFKQNMLLVIT